MSLKTYTKESITKQDKPLKSSSVKTKKHKSKKTILSKTKVKTLKSYLYCKKLYPEIFNICNVKPIKIGARQEMIKEAEKKGIKLTNSTAYNALFWITSTIQYKEAIIKNKYRFNIYGEKCSLISDADKTFAAKALVSSSYKTKEIAIKTIQFLKNRNKPLRKKTKILVTKNKDHKSFVQISYRPKKKEFKTCNDVSGK